MGRHYRGGGSPAARRAGVAAGGPAGRCPRQEFQITLVKIHCEALPIVGRACWRTKDKVVLLSVVDYRKNSQSLQQGLITAYCLKMVRCPPWVNRPFTRGGSGFIGGGGNGGGGGGGW